MISSALQLAHKMSVKNDFKFSGIGVGFGSIFPRIKCSTSDGISASLLSKILIVKRAATMSL